ncbi:MAG: phosphate acyltransferase [Candidatus Binatota bacterium]|jgi:glycerol-3-phosphate acyltransferase PlsX|nr:phosphate acyltransferase [Candidatus Binatota bacterium]
MKSVAVDAMGGDHAPGAIVEGAVAAARELSIPVTLVGRSEIVDRELARHDTAGLPIAVRHASEVIAMDDSPIEGLRRKKDNSIRVALELVRAGESDAFVSAGNSGAAMASAVMILGNLPGVNRPAIALEIPSRRGHVTLLDAGANAECVPLNLVQFAVMGDIVSRSLRGIQSPRVGIVSNGEESSKGTALTRVADHTLRSMGLNYVGYVEGRDLNAGKVDVAVTDGFTGNVILKSMEGLAAFILSLLRHAFEANWRTKLGYLLVRKELDHLRQTLDHDAVGGAPLLGVNGVTIVAHGASSPRAIRNAIRVASESATKRINAQILEGLKAVPEMAGLAESLKARRGLWQQIKGRLRGGRDGKEAAEAKEPREASDGDAAAPAAPETDSSAEAGPPRRES